MSFEDSTPLEEVDYDYEDQTPVEVNFEDEIKVDEPVIERDTKEKKKIPYQIIYGEDLEKEIKQDVKNTQEILCVSEAETKILLKYYNWNSEKLTVDFFEKGMEYIFKKAGITTSNSEIKVKSDTITCHGCFEDDIPKDKYTMLSGCGHSFCNECWKGYLTSKIKQNISNVKCMHFKCEEVLKDDFIHQFVNTESKEKFKIKLVDDYVTTNKLVKWCPSIPPCGHAVKIIDSISTLELPITCKCGITFCYTCLEDSHIPASCEMIQKWKIKSSKEALNIQWINLNTKKCPKCSNPIEKNGGCNHMRCTKCSTDFCWACGIKFENYGHSCISFSNKFNQNSTYNQFSIDRDVFYVNKYLSHNKSYEFELKSRGRIVSLIDEEKKWLKIPAEILVECRKAIVNSYIYSYYEFDLTKLLASTKKKTKEEEKELKTLEIYELLFENHLKQLERNTEKLSNYFEYENVDNVDENKMDILETVESCKKAARGLLDVIKKQQMKEYEAK